jgi:hypothetical protein
MQQQFKKPLILSIVFVAATVISSEPISAKTVRHCDSHWELQYLAINPPNCSDDDWKNNRCEKTHQMDKHSHSASSVAGENAVTWFRTDAAREHADMPRTA